MAESGSCNVRFARRNGNSAASSARIVARSAKTSCPVFVAEQFPHIRVESCDTCKYYLRSIDLTKDGNAVPLVDDLAAIPLSFWAEENGYRRIQANLLGT